MSRGVKLSPKHGVNPMVTQCFFCLEDSGVALLGRLPGDAEAPRHGCIDRTPCSRCEDLMRQGVILVSTRDVDDGKENPYRTGGWVVVRDEAIRRIVQPSELADRIIEMRFAFVPDTTWDAIGLPREPESED
jgi:hypothetical protein